jgi:RNA polymerase sigma-70 factor (ECF subfamily)
MEIDQAADDLRLIARIAIREESALAALYMRYRPRLRLYLWPRLGGDEGLIEEILQDTFLAVWENGARFRGDAKVATWLFQIAHFRATVARRYSARRPNPAPLLAAERGDTGAGDLYAESVVARLAIHSALAKLSEKHREILDLFFYQGFTAEEIATILGIPAGTVRSRLSYARKALRQELDAADETYSAAQARIGEER